MFLSITHEINESLDDGFKIRTVSFDISKAFVTSRLTQWCDMMVSFFKLTQNGKKVTRRAHQTRFYREKVSVLENIRVPFLVLCF